jgi:hypothetical protein
VLAGTARFFVSRAENPRVNIRTRRSGLWLIGVNQQSAFWIVLYLHSTFQTQIGVGFKG